MSDQLLTILKFCLLAVIYLFFFRVLRAVWAEITPSKASSVTAKPDARSGGGKGGAAKAGAPGAKAVAVAAPVAAGGAKPAKAARNGRKSRVKGQLVMVEPPDQRGRTFPVGQELSVGRAPGCGVRIDESFVSQLHARVFPREGNYVVEDLGSTNGTFLNKKRVAGPMVMHQGDRLQIGNTVLELE